MHLNPIDFFDLHFGYQMIIAGLFGLMANFIFHIQFLEEKQNIEEAESQEKTHETDDDETDEDETDDDETDKDETDKNETIQKEDEEINEDDETVMYMAFSLMTKAQLIRFLGKSFRNKNKDELIVSAINKFVIISIDKIDKIPVCVKNFIKENYNSFN